jgi:hypothetical protein
MATQFPTLTGTAGVGERAGARHPADPEIAPTVTVPPALLITPTAFVFLADGEQTADAQRPVAGMLMVPPVPAFIGDVEVVAGGDEAAAARMLTVAVSPVSGALLYRRWS